MKVFRKRVNASTKGVLTKIVSVAVVVWILVVSYFFINKLCVLYERKQNAAQIQAHTQTDIVIYSDSGEILDEFEDVENLFSRSRFGNTSVSFEKDDIKYTYYDMAYKIKKTVKEGTEEK